MGSKVVEVKYVTVHKVFMTIDLKIYAEACELPQSSRS